MILPPPPARQSGRSGDGQNKKEKGEEEEGGGLWTEKLLLRSSEIGLEELSISTQQAERRSGFIYSNAIPFLLLSRNEGEGKNR